MSCYHARLLEAVDIDPDARVLDIGCGTGQTTRAAARAASGGDALGVDISAPMLERARRLTNLEGLANARFECGDAQVHPLPAERFTIGLSRFGTMFFADPSAAFANIARALRPDARFVQLVWQDGSRQEWRAAVQLALTDELGAPSIPAADSAFSLADPAKVHAILSGAGFVDVQLAEVCEPVYYGAAPAIALFVVPTTSTPAPVAQCAGGEVQDPATGMVFLHPPQVYSLRATGRVSDSVTQVMTSRSSS